MSKRSLATEEGKKLFDRMTEDPAALPVSFCYDGKQYQGLAGIPLTEKTVTDTEKGKKAVIRCATADCLDVVAVLEYCAEFGETEYTVWFENNGKKPSGVLSGVYALDRIFYGEAPVLRGCMGDHQNWYSAYEHDLRKVSQYFRSDNGRATHIVFPYFDLCCGDGGMLMALGWAGTWDAVFSACENAVTVKARTCLSLNGVLMPGEKIRTGLVVLLPYRGRNADDATNLWREWFMKYNLPRANAAGDRLTPFSTVGWAGDTGLPNSDGSISERSFTWKPTLEKLIREDMLADFRWFDAGWYYDPSGRTVETDWWGTVGTWELDRDKWPGNSFRESNEACHAAGMKVLVWFEPERVTHVDELCRNYGYKKEWAVTRDNVVFTSDLGNPECLAWTLGRITKMMAENEVDLYREDNNSDPAGAWMIFDARDAEQYGLPRNGIHENLSIQGHYALWDGILDFCARNGKCTFLDSCASGGGRNDIESMRRGIPFMRSDYDRTNSALRLSQTSTLCKWIPFHGSCTKETAGQLETSKGAGSSPYVNRASFLPVYNYGEAFTHNPALDFDLMRRNFREWKSVRHLLVKDFYVLTPWHSEFDRFGWTAFAYDDSELGESLLLAFRMEDCRAETFTARLPFADPYAVYTVENADTGASETVSGAGLRDGYPVTLKETKSSAMFRIRKN